MKTFDFWQKWLFIAAAITVAFGILLAMGYNTPLFTWMRTGVNGAFFQSTQEITPVMHTYQAFTVGLLGAATAGWGVMIAYLINFPFKRRERWSWICLLVSILTWFILDESLSIYYGVYFNALFNLVFLVMFLLPLLVTRNGFKG